MVKFSERLKFLRYEKKISQKKLAQILNTNNSSISDWECGRSEPNIFYITALCKYFQCSSDYLLGLED